MTEWNPRANEIFAEALEFEDNGERSAFIVQACSGDQQLLACVQRMLESNHNLGSFLNAPAHNVALIPPADFLLVDTPHQSAADTDLEETPHLLKKPLQKNFGEYELLEEVARGGMGVVFKARQTKLNRVVALKMILTGQLASEAEVQRFRAEAKAAAGLEHVGIVPVYEVGQHAGIDYFSMGYVDGGSLSRKLKDGPLRPRAAALLVMQIANAVAYAHGKGVVHRDLKPANVLLDHADRPKITDFGIAKRTEDDHGLTKTGQIMGTPGFMPPEQAAGRTAAIGPSVDIYAIGAILYNLLTDRPPFQSASMIETLQQVMECEPISPRLLNASVDRDLETICLKCLEKEPTRRYASAQELSEELSRFLEGIPIRARPISASARGYRWCMRNKMLASVAMTAVLVLIAGTMVSSILGISATRAAAIAKEQRLRADENAKMASRRESEATTLLEQVQKTSESLRQQLYFAQMNTCGLSAETDGGSRLLRELVGNWNTRPSGPDDVRGWEWHLFKALADRSSHQRDLGVQQFALDWSPDGKYLAVGGVGTITILADDGSQVAVLEGHDHFVRSLSWDPVGKRLASGSYDGTLLIWDDPLNTNTFDPIPCFKKPVLSLDWSHDGNILAALLEYDNRIELWEPGTDHEPAVIMGSGAQLQFSPHGRRLACGHGKAVKIWQVDSPHEAKVIQTSEELDAHVASLTWDPASEQLAVGLLNGNINLWHVESDEHSVLTGHTDVVYHLSWSQLQPQLASAGLDYTVRLWDTENARSIEALRGHTDRVFCAKFNPGGTAIASAGEDGIVRFWEPGAGVVRSAQAKKDDSPPMPTDNWQIKWNPDHGILATSRNSCVTFWDEATLSPMRVFSGAHVCWNSDGRLAAFSGPTEDLLIWNTETKEVQTQIALPMASDGSEYRVQCLEWSPHQDQLAIICRAFLDGRPRTAAFIWDVNNDQPSLHATLESQPLCAEWNADGKRLAIGSGYGEINILDIETTSRTTIALSIEDESVQSLNWAPSKNQIALACGDHTVRIHDLETGVTTTCSGHSFAVWDVAWHPTENRIASASGDGTIKLWEPSSSSLVTTLTLNAQARAVAWHPDGTRLAAMSSAGALKVWGTAVCP